MQLRLNQIKNILQSSQQPMLKKDQQTSNFSHLRNNSKLKLPNVSKLSTLGISQIYRQNKKTKLKLPPIAQYFQSHCQEHSSPSESTRLISRKLIDFNLQHLQCQTQRPLQNINKLSDSAKSTTNKSETKSIFKQEPSINDQFQLSHFQDQIKKLKSTLTRNSENHSDLKNTHRSTNKCLIAVSKRLPFSLEKKKTQRRMSFGAENSSLIKNLSLFPVNVSGIFSKLESKQNLDDIEGLNEWCKSQ